MTQLDNQWKLLYGKIDERIRLTFIVGMLCGLVSHSFMLFNKITFYDDVHLMFRIGGTYKNGRWLMGLIELFNTLVWGKEYSIPAIKGLLYIVLIAMSAAALVMVLDLKSRTSMVLITCIMQVFPCVAVTLRYMFCSYAYGLALLFAVLIMCFVDKGRIGYCAATALVVAVFAIYQAYISVTCVIILLLLIKMCIGGTDLKTIALRILRWLSSFAIGLAAYFVLTKMFLLVTGEHLTSYQGISSAQTNLISKMTRGLYEAYYYFFKMFTGNYQGFSLNRSIRIVMCVLFIASVVLLANIVKNVKEVFGKVLVILFSVAFPMAINAVYVMVGGVSNTYIHGLMVYSTVFVFVIPIVLMEFVTNEGIKTAFLDKIKMVYIIFAFSAMAICYYAVLDNIAYLKGDLLQSKMESYFTSLITQIKSAEGYDPSYEVVLVQNPDREVRYDFSDASVSEAGEITLTDLTAYAGELENTITDYSIISFMEYRLGFDAEKILDYKQGIQDGLLDEIDEQKNMPCYPNYGSIRVIGDKIVIKLSECD